MVVRRMCLQVARDWVQACISTECRVTPSGVGKSNVQWLPADQRQQKPVIMAIQQAHRGSRHVSLHQLTPIASMRTFSNSLFALLFASLLIVGCGGESADTSAAAETADQSAEAANSGAIVIEATDMLQFSVTEFSVTEGEEVTIILKNVGQMAKEMGGHNLVILTEGDVQEFGVAAASASATGYIPADMEAWVLAHTELLGPGEEATLTFTAPAAGTYDFLCSFPGHFGTMRGVMTVEAAM